MPFTLTSLTDLPGGQQVETHPTISVGRFEGTLAGGASAYVVQQGAPCADWLIAVRSIVSWAFVVSSVTASPGATLRVFISSDPGLMGFYTYNCYPLPKSARSCMFNLVLPGIAAQFQLRNAHATENIGVMGHITIQGGF